ncbi:hypothetical protein [Candidatus Electronema sp. PJ]|uniref:hypothetical protein n=1 Tax=Candidatus Electronema sp. PJ TaxID=3401572 RepID=UPI003AA9C898
MEKKIFLFILIFVFFAWAKTSTAEINEVDIPNVEVNPGLNSVLSQKDSAMPNSKALGDENQRLPKTNGYVLPDRNIIVDNPIEPKCIFYGNYNEGSGDAFQYLDVNTIVFECQ